MGEGLQVDLCLHGWTLDFRKNSLQAQHRRSQKDQDQHLMMTRTDRELQNLPCSFELVNHQNSSETPEKIQRAQDRNHFLFKSLLKTHFSILAA